MNKSSNRNRRELFDRRRRASADPAPQGDTTYVQRRNNIARRFWRRFRILIPIGLLLFWFYMMWTNPVVLQVSGQVLLFVGRLAFVVMFIIVQFVAMFWFLGRTRSYDIYPDRTTQGLGYKDYPGQPELLERAKQIVGLLQGVRRFEVMGGVPLKGLLLEGPPGTGKTRLAQVISTEAGVPFFYVDGSSMQSMFLGMGNFKVMRFYAKARKAAKEYGAAIIFMDEIDSIGASRGGVSSEDSPSQSRGWLGEISRMMMGGMMGGGGSMLLSTLLVEMDGFKHEHGSRAKRREFFWKLRHLHLLVLGRPVPPIPNPHKAVLTIGATNRVSVLDPALLRPGRFDKRVRVDLPDAEGRKAIIQYYVDQMAHEDSVDIDRLVQDMIGYTPAAINYVLNDALRIALFDERDRMSYNDILTATAEFGVGLRQPIPHLREEDRVTTAYHETGHAVIQHALKRNKEGIKRLTIVRYGRAQGHMAPKPLHQRTHTSRTDLESSICVSFGGRAAEAVFLGDVHTGAGSTNSPGSDLSHIFSRLLMMADSAMLDDYYLGSIFNNTYDTAPAAVRAKFDELFERAKDILETHRDAVEDLVGALLEKEELDSDELDEIFSRYDWDDVPQPPGLQEGRQLGRHYVERVLEAGNGHKEQVEFAPPAPNGGHGEPVDEPGGD